MCIVKILVVEDYEPFRRHICSELGQQKQFEVIQASDGSDALRKTEELQPNLILLDISLPLLNGIEVAKRVRDLAPFAKVLFLSQNFSSDLVQEALRLGAVGYVQKALAGTRLLPAVDAALGGSQFVSGHMSDTELMVPHGTFRHEAQLYSDDTTLVESLAHHIRSGLGSGNAAIVVATQGHRSSLDYKMKSFGIDPARAIADGRLILLDASETLSQIVVNGMPDSRRFFEVTSGLIEKANSSASSNEPCATVFGEMVALLWEDGAYQSAVQLERLWNKLASKVHFSLRCAYPFRAFGKTNYSQLMMSVCPTHSLIDSL